MRGFNQAEVMAQPLAAQWGAQVSPVLLRTRNTAYQASCTAEERMPNVHNAFSWALDVPTILEGKHLVLVDDLMTTGATLVSAARLLATMRPASLHAIVAARVV